MLSSSLTHDRNDDRPRAVAVHANCIVGRDGLIFGWQPTTMNYFRSYGMVILVFLLAPVASSFAQQEFFPSGALGETPQLDKGTSRWYSSQLHALHEPSLWELSRSEDGQTYRFLWLRTWNHPMSVRLDIKADGTGRLFTKVSSGTGGDDPGKLILDQTRELTKKQVAVLQLKVKTIEFWTLPTGEMSGGRDGARWIVEASCQRRYHIVDRWSPGSGPVRELALYLVHLSDLEIPPKDL